MWLALSLQMGSALPPVHQAKCSACPLKQCVLSGTASACSAAFPTLSMAATVLQFFQKNDNQMNDAFMIATGVAALYLVYKVFEQLETLN